MLPEKTNNKITQLYGTLNADEITDKISAILKNYDSLKKHHHPQSLTACDIMLITYADTLHQPGFEPLKSLIQFCRHHLKKLFSTIHILPFSPYSSDDGFSVIDFRTVNPSHGNWSYISQLSQDFDLCFDLVLNHVSASSDYFKGYLDGDPQYQDFFIELSENADTSSVVRPRALPLMYDYSGKAGEKSCWATFSRDQIDFNFKNPAVLLEMIDILLFYISQGARVIRMDAIAYLWKQLGTSCVHLPQTHLIVQLMRDILDIIAPHALLLTETNFPHQENISYFGDGYNEAQIVYNFPLPPLILHTITSENARRLTDWAATIQPVSDRTTFLNFTASHDGIGVRPVAPTTTKTQSPNPAELDQDEFDKLIKLATDHGGQVSCKNDSTGQPIPYELNINYFDAINNLNDTNISEKIQIDRFLLSQSIALVLRGIPAIYIHSLIGSRNFSEGVAKTGRARTINREKIELDLLENLLHDDQSRRGRVFTRYTHMISLRRRQNAFSPQAGQYILNLGDDFFALARTSTAPSETILAIHNVTHRSKQLNINPSLLKSKFPLNLPSPPAPLTDLITEKQFHPTASATYELTLKPYQFLWLKTAKKN